MLVLMVDAMSVLSQQADWSKARCCCGPTQSWLGHTIDRPSQCTGNVYLVHAPHEDRARTIDSMLEGAGKPHLEFLICLIQTPCNLVCVRSSLPQCA